MNGLLFTEILPYVKCPVSIQCAPYFKLAEQMTCWKCFPTFSSGIEIECRYLSGSLAYMRPSNHSRLCSEYALWTGGKKAQQRCLSVGVVWGVSRVVQRKQTLGSLVFYKTRFEIGEPNQWSVFFPGIPHGSRAARKLFQISSVAPTSTAYAHASQKLLKGGAARLIIFWFTPLVFQKAQEDPSNHNAYLDEFYGVNTLGKILSNHSCFLGIGPMFFWVFVTSMLLWQKQGHSTGLKKILLNSAFVSFNFSCFALLWGSTRTRVASSKFAMHTLLSGGPTTAT